MATTDLYTSGSRVFREERREVVYALEPIPFVGPADFAFLKTRAAENPKGSSRLCLHGGPQELLQEMIIVNQRGCYVRPHAHVGKAESFSVLEGEAIFVVFDDGGAIMHAVRMGAAASGLPFYYRIGEGVWHSLVITSDWLVFHEATEGPFLRERTRYPLWAPSGADIESNRQFVQTLAPKVEAMLQ